MDRDWGEAAWEFAVDLDELGTTTVVEKDWLADPGVKDLYIQTQMFVELKELSTSDSVGAIDVKDSWIVGDGLERFQEVPVVGGEVQAIVFNSDLECGIHVGLLHDVVRLRRRRIAQVNDRATGQLDPCSTTA